MRYSKRSFCVKYNFEVQWLTSLCDYGIIPFDVKENNKKPTITIDDSVWSVLVEGIHYVTCPFCGKKMSSITDRHYEICGHKGATPLYCTLYLSKKAKTEVQKKAQSEKLKERFKTSEGEITKKIIGDASREFNADPIFKENKRLKSIEVGGRPDVKELRSKGLKEKWADPVFKGKMAEQVKNNITELRESAKRARSFLKKTSNLHIGYKKTMLEKGLLNFVSEYSYGPYSIDEADPLAKIAIEIDGCYWHGCTVCGFNGDDRIKFIDKKKTSYLRNRGWIVFRLKEHEIKKDPFVGIEMIRTMQSRLREINKAKIKESFFKGFLKVRSMVEKKEEPEWTPLSDVVRHNTPHKRMVCLHTDLGSVKVTEDHSVFDWLTKEPVLAGDLKKGSLIVGLPWTHFEAVKILEVEILEPQKHTYDVSVPGSENAVLDSGILVHNSYSISGVSLDIEKSSKYQSMADAFVAEYDKLVEQNKMSIKIIKGLRQARYGVGISSALGPMSRPGVQSRRNMISSGYGGLS